MNQENQPPQDPETGSSAQSSDASSDEDNSSSPPYRAVAMVLLALVVVAVGVGLVQLLGGDDKEPTAAPSSTTETATPSEPGNQQQTSIDQPGFVDGQPTDPLAPSGPSDNNQPGNPDSAGETGEPPVPGSGNEALQVPVRIYNNSPIQGLAERTSNELQSDGWDVQETSNYPEAQGVIAESAAYFTDAPGEKEAAEAIANKLGIVVKPRFQGLLISPPGVIVIVTQDLAG